MKFDYLDENNNILTTVSVNPITKKIKFKNYVDDPILCVFGVKDEDEVTYDDLMYFFESRSFDRSRKYLPDILKVMNLKKYDPIAICKFTKGRCTDDPNWIRFR